MEACKPLTLADLDRLAESFRFETVLHATPERIFEVLEDPESWPVWAGAIKKVPWTSPKPFGIGTTRDVDIMGGLTVHEHFFAWDAPTRMGFYFVGTNKPAVNALAEYYELEPLGDGRTRFVWRFGYESRGFMRYVSPLLRPAVRLMGARIVRGLERYVLALPAAKPGSTPRTDARAFG